MAGDGWREVKLGEVVELKRGYDLPQRLRQPGEVPIVSSSGISGFHSEPMVKGPGVVTGRYGTIGTVFFIEEDFWPHNTTLYVRDFKGNDPKFVSYFLRTLDYLAYSDKAAVPGVNRNHLHQANVIVPPLPEQLAIAHILGTLDDKIELNRRMNETLEAMARALFKSWFVDFDPVRAKMEGRKPAGMDKATAALFPDAFQDSALGKIPKGWRVGRLTEHVQAVKGLSYKGAGLSDAGIPLHNLNSVYEGGGYKFEGIKHYLGEYKDRHIVHPGDLIVTNTEQGHDRLLIGYAAIVPRVFGDSGLFSHHIYRVRPLDGSPVTPAWLCYLLNSPAMHDTVSGFGNGTTVNMLPVAGLQHPEFVVPCPELIQKFDGLAMSVLERHERTIIENRTLTSLRDALLPKLLSGEIRVRDAERRIEEAI